MSSRKSFAFGDLDSSDDESGQTGSSSHKGLYHSPTEGYGNYYFGSEKGKMNSTSNSGGRSEDVLDQDSESEEDDGGLDLLHEFVTTKEQHTHANSMWDDDDFLPNSNMMNNKARAYDFRSNGHNNEEEGESGKDSQSNDNDTGKYKERDTLDIHIVSPYSAVSSVKGSPATSVSNVSFSTSSPYTRDMRDPEVPHVALDMSTLRCGKGKQQQPSISQPQQQQSAKLTSSYSKKSMKSQQTTYHDDVSNAAATRGGGGAVIYNHNNRAPIESGQGIKAAVAISEEESSKSLFLASYHAQDHQGGTTDKEERVTKVHLPPTPQMGKEVVANSNTNRNVMILRKLRKQVVTAYIASDREQAGLLGRREFDHFMELMKMCPPKVTAHASSSRSHLTDASFILASKLSADIYTEMDEMNENGNEAHIGRNAGLLANGVSLDGALLMVELINGSDDVHVSASLNKTLEDIRSRIRMLHSSAQPVNKGTTAARVNGNAGNTGKKREEFIAPGISAAKNKKKGKNVLNAATAKSKPAPTKSVHAWSGAETSQWNVNKVDDTFKSRVMERRNDKWKKLVTVQAEKFQSVYTFKPVHHRQPHLEDGDTVKVDRDILAEVTQRAGIVSSPVYGIIHAPEARDDDNSYDEAYRVELMNPESVLSITVDEKLEAARNAKDLSNYVLHRSALRLIRKWNSNDANVTILPDEGSPVDEHELGPVPKDSPSHQGGSGEIKENDEEGDHKQQIADPETALLSGKRMTFRKKILSTKKKESDECTFHPKVNAVRNDIIHAKVVLKLDNKEMLEHQMGGTYSTDNGFMLGPPAKVGMPLYFYNLEKAPYFEKGKYVEVIYEKPQPLPDPNMPSSGGNGNGGGGGGGGGGEGDGGGGGGGGDTSSGGTFSASSAVVSVGETDLPVAPPMPIYGWYDGGDVTAGGTKKGKGLKIIKKADNNPLSGPPKKGAMEMMLEELQKRFKDGERLPDALASTEKKINEKDDDKKKKKKKKKRRNAKDFTDVIDELSFRLARMRGEVKDEKEEEDESSEEEEEEVKPKVKSGSKGAPPPPPGDKGPAPPPPGVKAPPKPTVARTKGEKAPMEYPEPNEDIMAMASVARDQVPAPPALPARWPPVANNSGGSAPSVKKSVPTTAGTSTTGGQTMSGPPPPPASPRGSIAGNSAATTPSGVPPPPRSPRGSMTGTPAPPPRTGPTPGNGADYDAPVTDKPFNLVYSAHHTGGSGGASSVGHHLGLTEDGLVPVTVSKDLPSGYYAPNPDKLYIIAPHGIQAGGLTSKEFRMRLLKKWKNLKEIRKEEAETAHKAAKEAKVVVPADYYDGIAKLRAAANHRKEQLEAKKEFDLRQYNANSTFVASRTEPVEFRLQTHARSAMKQKRAYAKRFEDGSGDVGVDDHILASDFTAGMNKEDKTFAAGLRTYEIRPATPLGSSKHSHSHHSHHKHHHSHHSQQHNGHQQQQSPLLRHQQQQSPLLRHQQEYSFSPAYHAYNDDSSTSSISTRSSRSSYAGALFQNSHATAHAREQSRIKRQERRQAEANKEKEEEKKRKAKLHQYAQSTYSPTLSAAVVHSHQRTLMKYKDSHPSIVQNALQAHEDFDHCRF